jgi:hypothetical protein
MTEPHRIRLRGGWTISTDDDHAAWTLPCPGGQLAARGSRIRLVRRFNHPPVRSESQICRLIVRHVAGVVEVEVDGQKFTPAFPVDDHPEAGFDFELPATPGHMIALTVETELATEVAEWGEIWLEIFES